MKHTSLILILLASVSGATLSAHVSAALGAAPGAARQQAPLDG
ncbi:MAG: hypothetical protein JWP72_1435, partial [Massilia sp.]|nr:hypothetical protein [Massilia sp.]